VAFQSLYRRYRPRRFAEVRGQDHVMQALTNAVREENVGHAYLFSGPRGTGKTSTARILAKALNCEKPVDGEPCCECESCVAMEAQKSLDVIELDAASNNGVDAMRDLVARAALGTGGRAKVYIVDEVHMLSTAASNVLLKPLEEPPPHVTWVLATTDPQKVLPTIRSRTQHFEFRLISDETLTALLNDVAADAGLAVDALGIASAVRRGRGSARDAESALDQIVAAGGPAEDDRSVDDLVEALCERDTGMALAAVGRAVQAGRDPRVLAEAVLSHLRDNLLAVVAPEALSLSDDGIAAAAEQGRRLGPPGVTRALDAIGQALLDMREAPDPRVSLEVALVRLTRPELDTSPGAIVERLDRLERAARSGSAGGAGGAGGAPSAPPPAPPRPNLSGPAAGARKALGAVRDARDTAPAPPAAPEAKASAPTEPPRAAAAPGSLPTRDELTVAWGDSVLKGLRVRVKGLFSGGRFVSVDDDTAVFAFESDQLRKMAEASRGDVESALSAHFGRPVPLRLTVTPAGTPAADEQVHDLGELVDAPTDARAPIEKLRQAFPGAVEVDGQ
jgi:DNA polymerase-3 subunit gamma/tau